jgi:hypothetical protein
MIEWIGELRRAMGGGPDRSISAMGRISLREWGLQSFVDEQWVKYISSLIAVRRAARVSPMEALRCD